MMTNREAFDTVKTHLLTQMEKSRGELGDTCMYRGTNGRKCAIGCLIPDNEYHPSLEGAAVSSLKLKCLQGLDRKMLSRLQSIHDIYRIDQWKGRLDAVEREFFDGK